VFSAVEPTDIERAEARPGDGLVTPAAVVMDRAFTVPGTPEQVWPWLAQLGKQRGGWYFPRSVERFIPARRRGLRRIDPRWQQLAVGQDVPDYGGRDEFFTVDEIDPPNLLIYRSRRRDMRLSWSIVVRLAGAVGEAPQTRVLMRLRMGPIKRVWLAKSGGELIDVLTIAGAAAGLRERLEESADGSMERARDWRARCRRAR